jgi:hypothetical protein
MVIGPGTPFTYKRLRNISGFPLNSITIHKNMLSARGAQAAVAGGTLLRGLTLVWGGDNMFGLLEQQEHVVPAEVLSRL